MAQILVVDDDAALCKVIQRYLTGNGYAVLTAGDTSEALRLTREIKPDLLLLDVQMPGIDGNALCRLLKKQSSGRELPVIMMSGERIAEKDVVFGLQGGADDYIVKPFSFRVLLARIQALLRRSAASPVRKSPLKKGAISLYAEERIVKVSGKPVALTRKEFDLLAALISKKGRILSSSHLLESIWGYDPAVYNNPGTVEVHVFNLRKKLGPKAARHIVNVMGHGYRFEQ